MARLSRSGLHSTGRRHCLKSALLLGGHFALPAGVVGLVGCSAVSKTSDLQGFNGKIMGTGYSVLLGSKNESGDLYSDHFKQSIAQRVHSVLQDVDLHMSTWRSDSEISQFNKRISTEWQATSPATMAVLSSALNTSSKSQGAFDVSVAPVVDLWGFGAGSAALNNQSYTKPASKDISNALLNVGYESLELDVDSRAIRKHIPGLQVDLSGIAKGHAVDRVASLLVDTGVEHFLVEVGGELRSSGRKPNASDWRVAIERPGTAKQDVFRVVELKEKAIATSGNYRNFFMDGGQRYSHSIDPRTGQSVLSELASVTVIANSTMEADALSTAMMVMGPTDAMVFAEENNIAAHCILKSGLALEENYSKAFTAFLV